MGPKGCLMPDYGCPSSFTATWRRKGEERKEREKGRKEEEKGRR